MVIHFVPQRLGLFDERGREGPEWPDWLGALMRRMGGTRGTKAGARGSCQVSWPKKKTTKWGPQTIAKLVYNSNFSMVYGTYTYS